MLIFACLTDVSGFPDGSLQIGGRLTTVAPGQSSHPSDRIDPGALQAAAAAFLTKGTPALTAMFQPAPVGVVDDIAVAADGSLTVTATLTEASTIRKTSWLVYKALAVAIFILGRDPADPDRTTRADILGVSLVDRPADDLFRLAKMEPPQSVLSVASDDALLYASAVVLDLDRRLAAYDRPGRR